MKKTLLMTTALVAVMSATNVYAEDLNLSEDMNIIQKDYTVENGELTNPGIVEGNVTKQNDGNINITDGIIKIETMYAAIDHMGNGDINIKDNANIIAKSISGLEIKDPESGELYNPISNAIVHTGDGDINIQDGNIALDNAGIFKIPGCSGGGYGDMCSGTPNNVSGDINISGGTINATNGSVIKSTQNINISGGKLSLDDSEISADGKLSITKGTINSIDGEMHGNGIEVSGGNIALNGTDFTNDDWNGSFKLTDGSIIMNGNGSVIGTNHSDEENAWSRKDGKFEMTGGNITVNGSENYIEGGEITISDGTIDIAQGAHLQTAATIISSGISSEDGDDAMAGEVATIKLTDNGTINLSGTLVSDVSGDGNLNVKSSSALVDGNVSGSNLTFEADHSLSKAIGGTISNITALNVNKGTLTYDKDAGSIGNVSVAGGAGLDIGTNKLTATTVNFADNSTLGLKIASADNYGQINANTINIGNDTTMKVTLDSGVVANGETKSFDFLQGSVTGDFTNKIADNNRYDINFEDGSFKITGTASASDVVADAGGSVNNAKTAEAWDSISSSTTASAGAKAVASVLSDLSQNNEQAYVAALTAVAPEVAPAVQQTSTETANQVFGAVGTRLTGGTVSTGGEGMSSGDSIFKRGAMWVQGLFNKSKLDDTSKAKGFDADTNGVAFGAEKYVNDDVKVGVGYAYSQTDIDGFMRSTDVDTHTAIVYGEYKPSNWYVNGIATYGWSDYEENKNVAGVGVKADYDVETFGLQAMTGYDMQVKGFGFTPEAGLRYVHIKQDGYKDSADQRVSANDSDILTGVIGAKVSKSWELSNGMNIKPEARIAATYDLMNDDVNSVVTLANGSAYAVEGEALDRFGMEFGAGVTAEVNSQVELSLGYEGKFREDYQDHTGLINAKYKF